MKHAKKYLLISNLIALVLTIAINYLSSAGRLNGTTIKEISAKYSNYFTPAGYAFSIWGVIYLGLLGFVCYSLVNRREARPASVVNRIGWLFVSSCLANSLWVVAWLNDYLGLSVILMVLLLSCLMAVIIRTRMELDAHPLSAYIFIYWPFAIYSGWITVALIANISAYLTKIGWDGWGVSEVYWAVTMIVIAGLINIMMVIKRNLREFAAVGIWALIAISVDNQNQNLNAIRYICYIVTAVLLAVIIGNGARNARRSINRM
ncbi:hypothetical protein [Pedobacter rhizosphaerae]|uniref:TspO and MBR related proteins n=1 Tax=Pedobacter rhizosphaerae TaxID=390241 RepID=A0A1H9T2V6_9SPHI|nr:hypothetical protein [Pedobacter rhizosphaerae]SER91471.1 hypothetical protein SAMN04488023_12064 [Pedobacter rhizosphaerae]